MINLLDTINSVYIHTGLDTKKNVLGYEYWFEYHFSSKSWIQCTYMHVWIPGVHLSLYLGEKKHRKLMSSKASIHDTRLFSSYDFFFLQKH